MKIITLSLISFIALMLGMGAYMIYATGEKPESDYYAMDLAYQNTIEAKRNVADLSQKPIIQYDNQKQVLMISFSDEVSNPQGKVQVLNIADQSQDFKIKLSGQQVEAFPLKNCGKGLHQVIIYWESEDKSYYYDEKMMF